MIVIANNQGGIAVEERAKEAQGRAKALTRSGVFEVHRLGVCAANQQDASAESAPRNPFTVQPCSGQVRSAVRKSARSACATAFRKAAERLGLSAADIAAAIDEPRQRVVDFMTGARPFAAEHAYLIGIRLPALLAAYGEELFGGGR